MKVNYAEKNVMNIEKSIVKNIKIDTTRNKGKDMKKMKSIEKESRDREDYLKVKLFFCSVCNKSMSQKYFYDHIKTKKHNDNFENKWGNTLIKIIYQNIVFCRCCFGFVLYSMR